MKYTDLFKNTGKFFPANEIDKITSFISDLLGKDDNLQNTVNPLLFSKVQDIWDLFDKTTPSFIIHLCSNYYNPLEPTQKDRFEHEIKKYSNFQIKFHSMPDFVEKITKKGKEIIDAKIKAIDKKYFEKSDGDVRALIVDVDIRDLIRIVINDEELRNNSTIEDYSILLDKTILEDAFDENVRIYLRQRSKINRNIKETALSNDSPLFFYFNNGITITCKKFEYPKGVRGPLISLSDLQIVNGGQTMHALFEAFLKDQSNFEEMDILCRIYETQNEDLKTKIAEYTNSQNPVNSRDIRSNDFIQRKLERELQVFGFFYERKKGQFKTQPKDRRIDAEKAGQAIMAFFNRMPAEAKDKKRIIFAEKYDEVFTDEISADLVILAIRLFWKIEEYKLSRKKEILNDPSSYENESFILHSTYYIMYIISVLADSYSIEKNNKNFSELISKYNEAITLIRKSIEKEKKHLKGFKENYSHRMFFKSNKPKEHISTFMSKEK